MNQPPVSEIAGRRVLFLMAADAEYGPHLRARIRPVITGVGPIEAAARTAYALAALSRVGTLPDLVVSLGSAGSARLEHCAVYQATHVAWRDMDCTALGFERGVTPFMDLPALLPLPLRLPDIPEATLSTGANIVSGPGYDALAEDMVDMETFATLRACMISGAPLIALRGISDGKSAVTGLHDWTEYLHIVDERLAGALDRLETALGDGLLP
jgi:adenosylhomocysteine nucleosidase